MVGITEHVLCGSMATLGKDKQKASSFVSLEPKKLQEYKNKNRKKATQKQKRTNKTMY